MLKIINSISQRLGFPVICPLCSHYHSNWSSLCEDCNALIIPLEKGCALCCLPSPDYLCSHCASHKPLFENIICSYAYSEPLRTLIHQFKYQKALFLRNYFVTLMLSALTLNPKQLGCLVPVPMHPLRLKKRGFNHSAVLTKRLAKHLKIPCDLFLCEKMISTEPQAQLSKIERQANLINTFRAKRCTYPLITLVDDLFTTGSTAHALTAAIKQKNDCRVQVWCLARTLPKDNRALALKQNLQVMQEL